MRLVCIGDAQTVRGFRLAGDQLVATTTAAPTTTSTPPGSTPAAAPTFDIATAKVGKVHAGQRPRQEACQIEDAETGKRWGTH